MVSRMAWGPICRRTLAATTRYLGEAVAFRAREHGCHHQVGRDRVPNPHLMARGLIGEPVPPVITRGGPEKKNS